MTEKPKKETAPKSEDYYAFSNAKSAAIYLAREMAKKNGRDKVPPDVQRFLEFVERKAA